MERERGEEVKGGHIYIERGDSIMRENKWKEREREGGIRREKHK